MNKNTLGNRIHQIYDDLARLGNEVCAMEYTDVLRFPENFAEMTMEAALHSERLTCTLRNIVYTAVNAKKAEYLARAASAQGIRISHKRHQVSIILPSLLPKRRGGHSSEFLVDPLFFALSEYTMAHRTAKLSHATLCFVHVYGPDSRVRDYDNVECKQVQDVVAMFTLEDDSGKHCDVYHTTRTGPEDQTQIHVMPSGSFPLWLEAQAGQAAEHE